MNEKLKHISKYCCEPKSEAEYLAVKLAAEKGGVDWNNCNFYDSEFQFIQISLYDDLVFCRGSWSKKLIPVHEYCELLMKDESEFDRRVDLESYGNYIMGDEFKSFVAAKGYYWEIKGNEVSLVKDEE